MTSFKCASVAQPGWLGCSLWLHCVGWPFVLLTALFPFQATKHREKPFTLVVYLFICSKPCRKSWERLSQNYSQQPAWLPLAVQQFRITISVALLSPLNTTSAAFSTSSFPQEGSDACNPFPRSQSTGCRNGLAPMKATPFRVVRMNTSFVALDMLRQGMY